MKADEQKFLDLVRVDPEVWFSSFAIIRQTG